MLLQYFYINGRKLGEAVRTHWIDQNLGILAPPSLLVFCASCGEVYCRAPVADTESGRSTPWRPVYGCCHRCPAPQFYRNPPGSIWHAWGMDPNLPGAFPDAVLQWEYLRHLEWFDKLEGEMK